MCDLDAARLGLFRLTQDSHCLARSLRPFRLLHRRLTVMEVDSAPQDDTRIAAGNFLRFGMDCRRIRGASIEAVGTVTYRFSALEHADAGERKLCGALASLDNLNSPPPDLGRSSASKAARLLDRDFA